MIMMMSGDRSYSMSSLPCREPLPLVPCWTLVVSKSLAPGTRAPASCLSPDAVPVREHRMSTMDQMRRTRDVVHNEQAMIHPDCLTVRY